MRYESLEVSVDTKVAHIRLSRPERMNALAATFWRELPAAVRELAYTGDRLPAERAERLGFVNGLFDTHEALVAGTLEIARRIAAKSPIAIAATKDMISHARDHSVAQSFEYLNALQPGIFSLDDIRRSVVAVKAKAAVDYGDLPPLGT